MNFASVTEAQSERLVYDLYGLTDEEIKSWNEPAHAASLAPLSGIPSRRRKPPTMPPQV